MGKIVANVLLFLHVNTVNCRSQCMSPELIHRRKWFTGFITKGLKISGVGWGAYNRNKIAHRNIL